jgi:hypothetical protein
MRQIAAVEDQVGRGLAQIREDCVKRGSIAVDVGHDCDAHHSSPAANSATISPIFLDSAEPNCLGGISPTTVLLYF